ncbi:MAG: primosomal protein N' (replication factor Y) - superfamily II helicase [Pseudomonadota bacterium]
MRVGMERGDAFPCAKCGAQLAWRPGAAALTCPYCGTENSVAPRPAGPDAPRPAGPDAPPANRARPAARPWDADFDPTAWKGDGVVVEEDADAPAPGALVERDYETALRELNTRASDESSIETSTTTRCPGCGAEVSLGDDRLAGDCPFCATPLAKEPTHDHRHPVPQGLLPFALEEREAKGRMRAWLKGLWFAPNSLKRFAEANRPLSGVYVPHYTFDARGRAQYRGQRGDAYYVTKRVVVDGKSRTQRVRRIRWTSVSGRVGERFDDVLVPATATLTEFGKGAEVTSPEWDLQGMVAYDTAYLSGFTAEAPGLALERGFAQAAEAMEGHLRMLVRRDIGGDEQRILWLNATFGDVTFKHVLLPVWLASYRWKNRPFRVAINARTGRVVGERPWSAWKIAFAVLAALIAIGVVVFFSGK